MAKVCELCGKGKIVGQDGIHKHSGQWRQRAPKSVRLWQPNLRVVRIMVGGNMRKMRLCASCLKSNKVKVVEES